MMYGLLIGLVLACVIIYYFHMSNDPVSDFVRVIAFFIGVPALGALIGLIIRGS